MAKAKSVYSCTECGGQVLKWQGQCPHCQAWNTLVETLAEAATAGANRYSRIAEAGKPQRLSEVEAREENRIASGLEEFDRVLGGGLVPGSVVLIGGEPGIGKSTLLLQSLAEVGKSRKVLYVTGEESPQQIALRAKRLGVDAGGVIILADTSLQRIESVIRSEKPEVAVIDSIQTLYCDELQSAPGSVAQVRECAARLTRLAKAAGAAMVLIGHVTKEGAIAGPRVLEHMVDTVLYFDGDTHSRYRLIRAFKNRYGAVNELGVFAMEERGLKGVANPSALFLSQHDADVAGSCVMATQEGTRPLLVEIQALVGSSSYGSPRRAVVGWDAGRLAMILAVLDARAGLGISGRDIYL
ncbi:MAG: DNA repair protein RadA, partial [Burkholderiales bacterium]